MSQILTALESQANPEKALLLQRFFKTGPGEYGAGDKFLGLTVPQVRRVAVKYKGASLDELNTLLDSEFHEARQCALFILTTQFRQTKEEEFKKQIYEFYLAKTGEGKVNNWDLVDLTAPYIVGGYLLGKEDRLQILRQMAKTENLWLQRISIMATAYFIRAGQFADTLELSRVLLNHRHDLIHKAVGWMLREVGNKSHQTEVEFLNQHYQAMPCTMLRYSIEKFPEPERQRYLRGEI